MNWTAECCEHLDDTMQAGWRHIGQNRPPLGVILSLCETLEGLCGLGNVNTASIDIEVSISVFSELSR